MSTLFDQESAMKAWEYEITREANLRIAQAQVQVVQAQKQAAQSQKQVVQLQKKEILNAYNLYKEGFPIESISNAFGIPVQTLRKSFADYKDI